MATLTIRKVDPEVQKRLRVRAALNGRSMEAELRQILKDAVGATSAPKAESGLDLAEAIRRRFAPFGGVELDIPPRRRTAPRSPPATSAISTDAVSKSSTPGPPADPYLASVER